MALLHIQKNIHIQQATPTTQSLSMYTLWLEILARSNPRSFTSTGIFPAICARSECKKVLFARHN